MLSTWTMVDNAMVIDIPWPQAHHSTSTTRHAMASAQAHPSTTTRHAMPWPQAHQWSRRRKAHGVMAGRPAAASCARESAAGS